MPVLYGLESREYARLSANKDDKDASDLERQSLLSWLVLQVLRLRCKLWQALTCFKIHHCKFNKKKQFTTIISTEKTQLFVDTVLLCLSPFNRKMMPTN